MHGSHQQRHDRYQQTMEAAISELKELLPKHKEMVERIRFLRLTANSTANLIGEKIDDQFAWPPPEFYQGSRGGSHPRSSVQRPSQVPPPSRQGDRR